MKDLLSQSNFVGRQDFPATFALRNGEMYMYSNRIDGVDMQTTANRSEQMLGKSPAGRELRPLASVIDLFCGAGALSHGFLLEGFSIECGYDIDETCRFVFEENNNAQFVRRDVAKIDPQELACEFADDMPKILVGCAPCQPFSKYSQGREYPKWKLLEEFTRLVLAVLPDVVSMENVPQLTRFKGEMVFNTFVANLEDAGYQVRWMIADCTDFGVPQTRSRLVLIASRHGCPVLPKPEHDEEDRVTVWQTIGDMPPLTAGDVDPDDPLHCTSSMSDLNLQRIRASRPGGTWKDWDDWLVADCHKRETGRSYGGVYGRMHWHKPSPTITTQFYGFGNGRFGHPAQDRALSLREGAMLQTFPRDYTFVKRGKPINFKSLGRMIGNAVPVVLARAIARAVATHLEDMQ